MMDREVALAGLSVLCNAKITSGQRPGVWLPAVPIVGAAAAVGIGGTGGAVGAVLMTILGLAHRVSNGDALRLLQGDVSAGIPSLVEPGFLAVGINEDSRGILQLEIDEDEFFDREYDYDLTNITDHQTFYRGGQVYERPCGWKRFGLKVLGKYDDDTWLGNDQRTTDSVEGEWPVSYHGTTREGAQGIIEGHYKAGRGAAYGRGVYSTPDISVAERYATSFQSEKTGKQYKVLLQNRINPKYREKCKNDKYWLVEIDKGTSEEKEKEMVNRAIRPYGLLIKEI